MHLVINQSTDRTEQVTTACIDKLYNLSKSNTLDSTSYLSGSINAASAYEDAVTFLNTMWGPDLIVTASAYYIRFADPEVESVLKTALNKAEGEGITTQEAAAMNLGTIFKNNTNIESFDEFKYFISPSKTLSQQAFYNCSSLERLDLSNCRSYPDDAFKGLTNLEYTGGAGSPQGVIIIPEGTSSIGGSNNFDGCNKITSVVLPDSLTYIQGNNFRNMIALTEITVGTGMARWVRGNFSGCQNFNKVNIKDLDAWLNITFESTGYAETPLAVARHLYLNSTEVTSVDFTGKTMIKDKVLWGCLGLTSVVLPNTITSIGNSAFRSCDNLVIADLNLPNLTTLGSYAFSGTKVQTVSNLENIASINASCFEGCAQLASVIVPSTLTTIGSGAFKNCTNLSKIGDVNTNTGELNLPNLTGSLGDYAFQSCNSINKIISLGSITNIKTRAFDINIALSEIHLPATLTSSNENAFGNWNAPQIDKLYWEGTLEQWLNIDFKGECANPLDRVVSHFYINNQEVTSCTFPTGMTSVKQYVFRNYIPLTTVSLSSTIIEIKKRAFSGCGGLTTINTENVTTFGEYALAYCSSLTSVDLSNATSIGNHALRECTSLTSINIPNSVTSIGNSAFYGCSGLTSVTISNSVTTIGEGAFRNCTGLTSLTIGDGVTTIGIDAFNIYNAHMNTVILGSSLATVNRAGLNFYIDGYMICKATTPPSLSACVFNGNGLIYVPQDSVDTYKSASGWSTYAGRIQAIPTT